MGSVGMLVCRSGGKIYVFSSTVSGYERSVEIGIELDAGSYPNAALQDDWSRLGRSGFRFQALLDDVPTADLPGLKAENIARCASSHPDRGYNQVFESPVIKTKKKKKNAKAVKK